MRTCSPWWRMTRLGFLLFSFSAIPLGAGPARGAEAPAASVNSVLVYSTEARVFQRATATLVKGVQEVELSNLPARALQDSVRVSCKTAKVQHVEVIQAAGKLPHQVKAEALLSKIEALADQLRDLQDEQRVLLDELAYLDSLELKEPSDPPDRRVRRAPLGLFATAWKRILDWVEQRSARIRGRLKSLAAERLERDRALHALLVEGREMLPSATGQAVPRVVAHLKGRPGRHQVEISYRVSGVKWVPSYDLRYEPRTRSVEATYYAVVSQSTGEDWQQAKLRFSTATPTQLLAVPELATLTLGRKRDFLPQPQPRPEPPAARWTPEPLAAPEADLILQQLRQVVQAGGKLEKLEKQNVPAEQGLVEGRLSGQADVDHDGIPDYEDRTQQREQLQRRRYERRPAPSRPAPVMADKARADMAPASPPPARPAAMTLAEAAPAARRSFFGSSTSSYKPQETLPWSDAGYIPPQFDKDLPAAAAKGYRFTLFAPGRHTVDTSSRTQRIPLMRRRLKVRPVYRIVPGKSKQAYLMAEVDNSTGKPILRGHANLFSGAMFTGRSWINTALPGKTIKLPLGVDDGVKVERHIRQETEAEGVVFKDDVSRYTVQIEIANHHRYPIQVVVEDQVPVKLGKKVEIGSFSSSPSMTKPDKQGQVTWEGTVKASSVKKLIFKFNIVRPKDWDLRQYNG